jgi:Fur family transcriptional regulator, ferric uptake regulator
MHKHNAEDILRQHQLKVTPFRISVLDLFLDASHALPLNIIESSLNNPDRITLYRTLKNFEDKGLIHFVSDGTPMRKYALCIDDCSEHSHVDEHVHFHCTICLNTTCLDHVVIPQIALPQGYAFEHANMTVNGICKECGNSEKLK